MSLFLRNAYINSTMLNPNYPPYSSIQNKSEPIDLSEVTSALEDVKKAIQRKEVTEEVSISNFDEVKLHLKNELSAVVKAIKAIDIPEVPKSLEVTNFPKSEKYPDSMSVTNLSELGDLLTQLIHTVENITISPVVNVPTPIVNVPEQQAPIVNIPQSLPPILDLDFSALLSALHPLRLLSRDPNKPITVRMSDGRHFIDAISETLKENGERLATVVSTSYGLTKDEFKAANAEIEDPTRSYHIADKDDDASPNYYGFTDQYGKWYIMKETVSAGADTYRYVKGDSGYAAAWTARATQTYDYFNVVF